MVVWLDYVVSKLRCGRKPQTMEKDDEAMSTREVSDASSDRSDEGLWTHLAASADWSVQGRKSEVVEGVAAAMIPFTLEQGEIMQRLRCKALEICKYNGAHIRDNLRFDRLVRNTRDIPKKRAVALHPSIANMVDISKTTSVDSLPPECERARRIRRNTLVATVPVIFERDNKARTREAKYSNFLN